MVKGYWNRYCVNPISFPSIQVADILSKNYVGDPKSPPIQFVTLQQSLYMTTFICVLGGGFFLATALFIVQDRAKAERETKGR